MDALAQWRTNDPLSRWAGLGAAVLGLCGGVVGLVVGLFAYPPTAVFAMVEVGLPAAVAGALVGLLVGLTIWTGQRWRTGPRR